jgi:hypothetical protein
MLDLTHEEFSKLFGVSLRTVTNYATDGVPSEKPVAILAQLVLSGKITRNDIISRKKGK